MVRNSELPEMDPFSRIISASVKALATKKRMSNSYIAEQIGKSPTYVSLRIRGLDAWDTHDLSALAQLFGYTSAFGIVDEARGLSESDTPH